MLNVQPYTLPSIGQIAGDAVGWYREQIRAARLAPLSPLLRQRGLAMIERAAGNFELPVFPGVIIKDSYWRWPERHMAGNAIDFHVHVLGLSFHDAMRQITGT